jgi:thiamine kinase-like enzyme
MAMNEQAALEIWLKKKGRDIESFQEIGPRGAFGGRRAIQAVLKDGSQVKARWLPDEDRADAWHALREKIGRRSFLSDCLHRQGRMVVEEWVEGETLPMTNPEEDILKLAAEALAEIHCLEIGVPSISATCSEILEADSRIRSLVEREAISLSLAARLRELLRSEPPVEKRHGLTHLDFCGENLVRHPTRGIVSIDHEWMCAGSLEFDLARAICRWELKGAEAGVFVTAYKKAGGPACTKAMPWWLLANDIFAAEIRVRRGWADATETLGRLVARSGQDLQ